MCLSLIRASTDNSYVTNFKEGFYIITKPNCRIFGSKSVLDSKLPNWKQTVFFFFRGYVEEERRDCYLIDVGMLVFS